MSETEIIANSLRVWIPGPEGLVRCDVALSEIRVARRPAGGAVLVLSRDGAEILRTELSETAAVHLAVCLTGAPGGAR